ncbi:MAG: flavin reductase [Bacteroidales bacterium]|jgi:flavin reductase (DIM6/NTAB) family NADH-FMN oxidoreductase RutF/rubredoxin
MVDLKAFYKISYGLYIVSSGDKVKGNGFISNTVFQVTSDPAKFAVCCSKNNYTAELIRKRNAFSVSALQRDCSPEIIGRFGFKSGRDTDKMEGLTIEYGETGVPVVLTDCIAWLECRVEQIVDAGTHLIFIGALVGSGVIDDAGDPLTYLYYRQVKKGIAPKNAPTYIDPAKMEAKDPVKIYRKFRCPACGYIYDEKEEGQKFSDLPSDWICPVCGSEKSEFIEV